MLKGNLHVLHHPWCRHHLQLFRFWTQRQNLLLRHHQRRLHPRPKEKEVYKLGQPKSLIRKSDSRGSLESYIGINWITL